MGWLYAGSIRPPFPPPPFGCGSQPRGLIQPFSVLWARTVRKPDCRDEAARETTTGLMLRCMRVTQCNGGKTSHGTQPEALTETPVGRVLRIAYTACSSLIGSTVNSESTTGEHLRPSRGSQSLKPKACPDGREPGLMATGCRPHYPLAQRLHCPTPNGTMRLCSTWSSFLLG